MFNFNHLSYLFHILAYIYLLLVHFLMNYDYSRSLVVSDLRSETKGFPVRVRLLVMCRGEHSAVITRLMSKCL